MQYQRRRQTRASVRFRPLSAFGLVAVLLAACGDAAPTTNRPATAPSVATAPAVAPTPRANEQLADVQELRAGVSRNLVNGELDPWFAHGSLQVWEPLLKFDDDIRLVPVLAERWTNSADGREWTFALKQGVKFSDGEPFNADAALANFKHLQLVSGRPSIFLGGINFDEAYGKPERIEKVDDYTVRIAHHQPFPNFPMSIANFYSAMFSPKIVAPNGDFLGLPIGSGPYRLVDWKRDQYANLERNEAYWGPKPKLTKIFLRIYPDSNTRLSALRAGEVDALVELGAVLPAQGREVANDARFNITAAKSMCVSQIAFNGLKAPFDNAKLRQAVNLGVDREAVVRDLLYGYAAPAQNIMTSYNLDLLSPDPTAQLRYDPARAQALAKEALGGNRAKVTLLFSPPAEGIGAWPYPQIAAYLQSTLRPLSLDIELKQLESAALADVRKTGDFNMLFGANCWANGEPDYIFRRLVWSKATIHVAGNGNGGYNNPEVDRLLDEARVTVDAQERNGKYFRVQQLAAETVPISPLFDQKTVIASRTNVRGLGQRIAYAPTFETTYLVKTP